MAPDIGNKKDLNLNVAQNTKQVLDYIENLKSTAEKLALQDFPEKLIQLNEILESTIFKDRNCEDFHEELGNLIQNRDLENGRGELPPAKRKKLAPESVSENNTNLNCTTTVPSNKQIEAVVKIVKPFLKKLSEDGNLIKVWVSLLIPKIEDGNNFGVTIQASIVAEAQSVENDAHAYIEHISTYYSQRAKLVSKVWKYPFIDDYRQAVCEVDERQFISLYMILTEVRNRYYTLHDIIVKNFEKIKTPRTTNAIEAFY